MRSIDAFVMQLFERLSQWIQVWTGIDCLDQARVAEGVVAVACVLEMGREIVLKRNVDWLAALVAIMSALTAAYGRFGDSRIRSDVENGLRNYRKVDGHALIGRLIWLFAMVPFEPVLFFVSGPLFTWILAVGCANYLSACDPLPPCRSRLMEKIRNFGKGQVLQPVTENC